MKVLVVDDNPIVLRGMQTLLEDVPEVRDVLTAVNGRDALARLAQHDDVDLVCLDVRMPLLDGLGVLDAVAADLPVIMLTHSEEPAVIAEALAKGARGYLVHGTFGVDELVSALRTCVRGGMVLGQDAASVMLRRQAGGGAAPAPADTGSVGSGATTVAVSRLRGRLTDREVEIVQAVVRGLSNAAVGAELYLTEKTVKNHLNRIYAKVGVRSRTELVAAWHGTCGPAGLGPSVGS